MPTPKLLDVASTSTKGMAVNFRSLADYQKFSRWTFIDATWEPATYGRPESRHVHQDSI